jgi:NodT family efflux transporter outer membrane factor (OMF) lipoprotein
MKQMKKSLFMVPLLGLALSSCGIYNKYERPTDLPLDGLYGRDTASVALTSGDTASLAQLSWRQLFTDPNLQSLIERALEQNTDLLSARQRVKEAQAALTAAKLSYLPSFMLTPNGGVSSFDGSKGSWTYTAVATASWEVDLFGRLTNAKRRAKALYDQSREYEQAVSTSMIAATANLYYTLLMLDEQYRISAETAANWQESVRVMRAMMNAGMTNEAAVSQSEANCRSVEASLLDLRQSILSTENALAVLLGEVPGSEPMISAALPKTITPTDEEQTRPQSALFTAQFPEELSAGVPLSLLARRPDVRASEFALAQAFYSTNAARSNFYPQITLGGTAGWTNSVGTMIVNPGKVLLAATGSLVQPIFARGGNVAQLKVAKAQQEEALLAFRQTLLNAGSEVNDALVKVQTERAKADIRARQIESLETAVKSTKLLMRHGTTTYLDVITAQQSLLGARLTQTADRLTEIQGIISLYQALGGGRE